MMCVWSGSRCSVSRWGGWTAYFTMETWSTR